MSLSFVDEVALLSRDLPWMRRMHLRRSSRSRSVYSVESFGTVRESREKKTGLISKGVASLMEVSELLMGESWF